MKPILSICIPTMNRAGCLEEMLDSIFVPENAKADFEVVVSNNASTDSTAALLDRYVARGLPVRVAIQPVQVDLGVNLRNAVRHAAGRFLWYMGDDDRLYPDAIPRLISDLTTHDPDVLLANYSVWNHDFSENIIPAVFPEEKPSAWVSPFGPETLDLGPLTFLGCMILRNTPECLAALDAAGNNTYLGTYGLFSHAENGRWWLCAKPCVRQRMPLGRNLKSPEYFFRDLPLFLQFAAEHGASRSRIRVWTRGFLRATIARSLLGDKVVRGRIEPSVLPGLIRHYGSFAYTWLFVIPAYCLPVFLLKRLKETYSFNR